MHLTERKNMLNCNSADTRRKLPEALARHYAMQLEGKGSMCVFSRFTFLIFEG